MGSTNPSTLEEFFLAGLKEDIRHTVKMLGPYSLSQAVDKAGHQEKAVEVTTQRSNIAWGKSSN